MATDVQIKGIVEERQRAYQLCFSTPAGKTVLADLARVGFANATTFAPDSRDHAFNEGCRAIWLRITEHFDLTPDELVRRYKKTLTLQRAE